jgi:hypothetical protein
MKITLQAAQFVFTPTTNTVSFANMAGAFKPECLLAVINTTTGKLVYSAASQPSGFGGTFSTTTYLNDTLTYASSNTGQSASDILQVLYDDQTFTQPVSGTIASYTYDGNGNIVGSIQDPVSGDYKLLTASTTYAADGTPILSTVDPMTGGDGLNFHLQSSSYGGQIGNPIPIPNNNNALSVGFLNNSVLVSPAMDPVNNQLIVQTASSAGTQDVNVIQIGGNSISVDSGSSDNGTIRVASNNYSTGGSALDYGNGQITALGSQRISLGDYSFTGAAGVTVIGRNIITDSTAANDLDGYRYFSIQIVCTATAGTFIFETSNDDTNWQPLAVSNQSLTTGVIVTSPITATASSFIYVGTMTGRYIRIRIVTVLTGGSAQAVCRFSQVAPLANNVTISSGSASTVAPNIDVLGSAVSGSRYNQLEIDFNTAPGATLITNTTAGGGTITATNGHSLYATSSTATSSAKGVSVDTVEYRAANEMYGYFSAGFLISGGARTVNSYQRIGIYDTTNGFFIGYNGINFGVTKRTGGVDTFTNRINWNGDLLDGSPSSKFTRNNIPEALDVTKSNLFRIRFAWLGSASILFDIFSPDGIWVNYHSIKQPNLDFNPSLTIPNLPMTIDCAKTGSGAETLTIGTACWAGGTSSSYSKITSSLTDQSLASLNRSVITGVTTGGGGGYVNVKVNPSGALVTDSTISGTALVNQPDLYTLGSINTAVGNNLFNNPAGPGGTDAQNYKSAAVQVILTAAGGSIEFQHSSDNSTWVTIPVFRADSVSPNPITGVIAGVISSHVYHFPIKQRYIRLNVTATLSGSPRANLRLSQESWAPIVPAVVQSTAGNLNATVAGALTSVGTVTTVTTVTTVSGVTSAALAATVFSDIVSAAITTSQTSANILTTNQQNFAFQVSVTAVSGTNPTLDVVVQETFDGTTYYDIYHFPRITAIGQYRSPQIRATGSGIRYIRTVGGTTPSFTNSVNRPVRQTSSDLFRNFFDRTLDPNTLNSTTATFFMDGCDQIQLAVTMNAGGTAPIIKMQGSEDSTNWYDLPSMSITAAVGAVTQIMSSATSMPRFVRSIVATAGIGSSLAAVDMKGRGV